MTTSNETKVHLAVQRLPGNNALSAVQLRYDGGLVQDNTASVQRDQYWLIDRSGSMYDSIDELNAALQSGWNKMERKPFLLPFNDQCKELPRMRRMPNLDAGGGTSFHNAFLELMDSVQRHKSRRCSVLFFTDGHDYGGYGYRANQFLTEVLWPWMRANNVQLHVIGYSRNHDVDKMRQLIGDPQSPAGRHSFQYAANQQELSGVIDRIADLASPTFTFQVLGQRITLPVEGGESLFFVPTLDETLIDTTVTVPEANYKAVVAFDVLDEPDALLELAMLGHRLQASARDPTKAEVLAIDTALDEMAAKFLQLQRLERKRALRTVQEHKQVIASILALLAKGVHASTADKARVLQTAAAIRTQTTSFNKRLDQRVLKNEDLRTQIESRVEQATKALALKEEPKNADHYTCLLSFTNWFEALQDQDCICVSLVVTRPPTAIAQPALVRVQRVNYQCMTMDAFKMALDTGLLKWHNEIEAHGGFDPKKHTATVIKDRAIQPCNAVFPLYIDPRHWSAAARHYMQLALGWMATLDERGYSAAQWQTIPLLIYGWFLTHGKDNVATVHKDYMGRVGKTVFKMLGGEKYLTTLKTQLTAPNRENLPNPLLLFAGASLFKLVFTVPQMQQIYVEMVRRAVRSPKPHIRLRAKDEVLRELTEALHLVEYTDLSSLLDWNNWTTQAIGENVMPTGLKNLLKQTLWIVPYMAAVNGTTVEDVTTQALTFSTAQRHAMLAWGLWHCLDDKDRDTAVPDPIANPEACLRYFVGKVKDDWEERRRYEIQKAKSIASGNAYVTSNDTAFKFSGHHLFNGKDFKNFLETVRRLHASNAPRGTMVKAREKYAYLKKLGWYPAPRNQYAFESQFSD